MVGPASLKDGRSRYNQVIAYTGTEQMLTNVVKLKYRDSPTFLQVTGIAANLQWGTNAGAQIPVGDRVYSAGNLVPLSAGINYAENPTVTYSPLTGEAFVRQMMTPIPLETLILLFQSGWPIDTVLRLVVQEINDLENASTASGPTPELKPVFHEFLEVASILRKLQRRWVVEWAYSPEDGGKGIVHINPDLSPDEAKSVERLRQLLGLKRSGGNTEEYEQGYDVGFTEHNQIHLVTRSMTGILFYVSQAVDVPLFHVEKGLVTVTRKSNGEVFDWTELHKKQIGIHWSETRPSEAYMAIPYRGVWFYIRDNDLNSKSTFLLLQTLADLQAGTAPSAAPILTLPVAR